MTLKMMNISQRYVQDTEKSYSYIWGILLDFISSIVNFGNRNIYTYTFFHFKTQTYRYNHRHLWSHITKCFLLYVVAASAKSPQSCPTLWDPIDCHPWDSPGKNNGVGCHFLRNAWKWKVKVKSLSHFRLLATHGLQPTRLLHPWDFPGKSTGVGCHCLLRSYCITLSNSTGLYYFSNLFPFFKNLFSNPVGCYIGKSWKCFTCFCSLHEFFKIYNWLKKFCHKSHFHCSLTLWSWATILSLSFFKVS